MADVTVKFLGEEYQVSETINEFLKCEELLTPITKKLIDMEIENLNRDSKYEPSEFYPKTKNDTKRYKNAMTEAADLLVKQLLSKGIYDVTVNDLIENMSSFIDIEELVKRVGLKLCEEGQKFVDMKNAGMERAYSYAGSMITGSGVRVFSSSFATLMINSAIEKSIILSQAKRADAAYEKAIKEINARTNNGFQRMCRDIMVGEYYPGLLDIFIAFSNKIMSSFLIQLAKHGKFDFESVEQYNLKKAEEMLKNLNYVSDKENFLKQVFLTCPFCLDVYEACLKYDLLDSDTFETATYFGFADNLAEKIESYIKDNLKHTKKIMPLVSILASYHGTDEMAIWKKVYHNTIDYIIGEYKAFKMAMLDKKRLDIFVRKNLVIKMIEIIDKSRDEILVAIDKKMKSIISKEQYDRFIEMGIIDPATIRIADSSATDLFDINNEIKEALADCVLEYIEEAKRRLKLYDEAKKLFEEEVEKKESELAVLKSENEKLGFFAFSKKREISMLISNMITELSEFKSTQEPKKLWADFERMYS